MAKFDVTKYDPAYILEQHSLYCSRVMIEDQELRAYFKKITRDTRRNQLKQRKLNDPEYIAEMEERKKAREEKRLLEKEKRDKVREHKEEIRTFRQIRIQKEIEDKNRKHRESIKEYIDSAECSEKMYDIVRGISIISREEYVIATITTNEKEIERFPTVEEAKSWIIERLQEIEALN